MTGDASPSTSTFPGLLPYASRGYRFPYGDYLGIAVDDAGSNYVIWGEGDSYEGPGGTWYTRGE
jgi:hypothetical protein